MTILETLIVVLVVILLWMLIGRIFDLGVGR